MKARKATWVLAAGFVSMLALVAAGAWFAASGLRSLSDSLDTVYKDRVVCLRQLQTVDRAFSVQVGNVAARARAQLIEPAEGRQRIAAARRSAQVAWQSYRATYLTTKESALVAQTEPALEQADAAAAGLEALLGPSGRPVTVEDFQSSRLAFEALSVRLEGLSDLQVTVAREELKRAEVSYRAAMWTMGVAVAALALLGAGFVRQFMSRLSESDSAQNAQLTRLNDYYRALSLTNQLIVRQRDDNEVRLLQEVCGICVANGHALLACVFMLEPDGTATRAACVGPADALFGGLPDPWRPDANAARRSVTTRALLDGVVAVSQDYQHEAPSALWRDRAAQIGVKSVASFPLRRGGRPVGALSLYATELAYFDATLVALLEEMAADVSFALDNIDHERARAAALHATEESLGNFKAVFQAAPVSAVVADIRSGVVLMANDKFCERYGVAQEEIIGHTMAQRGIGMLPEDAERYRVLTVAEGRVRNLEVRTKLRNGELLTVVANSEQILYEGKPCILSMTTDITDLKQAALAREAQLEAEASNRAKTAFLSKMSHELRTPLNAMLGFAQLLRADAQQRLTPLEFSQLEHIHRAGWHLLALVNDVLDVSRIEAGQFEVHPRSVFLHSVLAEAAHLCEPQAAQNGVTIMGPVEEEADPRYVVADPVRLKQVFLNLISNAVKYNRRGGTVRVEVRTRTDWVDIDIADTGIGMTDEQLTHLFEPFNRLGHERSGIEGTGLGLSLTRELVLQMKGELAIESRAGEGTTARVSLQRACESIEPTPTNRPNGVAVSSGEPQGTVLYIEDNEVNVILVEQMLARWGGVRFARASDGMTGLQQALEMRPDLVLLDMNLPDMDGCAVLRELAARGLNPIRVVALSASSGAEEIKAAIDAGATDYWTKPLDLELFLRNVAAMLNHNTDSTSAQSSHP